ncbi:hypothetical protein DSO57_1010647 [Entomophthora muscae]|uniref:Uncharacterized protein n=1 Tax=Entomophthora muscae TaxID=34485 RepID=A0ACC2RXF5_9FUNG|nr:hypothetical protein DSO57_1010647 [Entomophthora muscae]
MRFLIRLSVLNPIKAHTQLVAPLIPEIKFQLTSIVRIVNFLSLETWVQERGSDLGLDYSGAASPKDQEAVCPHFFGIKSPQVEAANTSQDEDTSKNLETTAPDERQKNCLMKANLMSLKPILEANQDSPPEENAGLKAAPMTMT